MATGSGGVSKKIPLRFSLRVKKNTLRSGLFIGPVYYPIRAFIVPEIYRLKQLAELVQGRVEGNSETIVTALNGLELAGPDEITFISNSKQTELLRESNAGSCIVPEYIESIRNIGDHRACREHVEINEIVFLIHAEVMISNIAPPDDRHATVRGKRLVVHPPVELSEVRNKLGNAAKPPASNT